MTNPPRKRPNRLSKESWALIERVRVTGDAINPLTGRAIRAAADDAVIAMYRAWNQGRPAVVDQDNTTTEQVVAVPPRPKAQAK